VLRGLPARVATGAVFLPALVYLVHRGGWAYTGFVLLVVVLGAWEWWRLGRAAGAGSPLALVVAAAAGACLAGSDPRGERLALFLGLLLAVTLVLGLRHADGTSARRAGHLLLGACYVGLLPAFLVRMRALPDGREALYLTYLTALVCDTAAYGIGRALGRHPLWTRVSPRTTREGAIAGLLAAVAAAELARLWFAGFLGPWEALGFGLIVGVIGQTGDLIESLWKREAGVKDASALIPGHGGVLDRFDSLHFVAPVLYTYLAALR
jgi:phosphatidate cytidylyltransferase